MQKYANSSQHRNIVRANDRLWISCHFLHYAQAEDIQLKSVPEEKSRGLLAFRKESPPHLTLSAQSSPFAIQLTVELESQEGDVIREGFTFRELFY